MAWYRDAPMLAMLFAVLATSAVARPVAADVATPSVTLRLEGDWPSEMRREVLLGFTAEARGRGIEVTEDVADGEAPPRARGAHARDDHGHRAIARGAREHDHGARSAHAQARRACRPARW